MKLLRRQRERILNFPHDAHGSLLSTPLSSSALSSSFCNHGCHHHLHHISHHHRHQHLHNFHHNALWSAHLSRHPLAVAHHPHVDARHLLDFDLDVDQSKIFLRLGFSTWPGGSPAPVCRRQKNSSPLFSQLLLKLPSSHFSDSLFLTQRLFLENIFFIIFPKYSFLHSIGHYFYFHFLRLYCCVLPAYFFCQNSYS